MAAAYIKEEEKWRKLKRVEYQRTEKETKRKKRR